MKRTVLDGRFDSYTAIAERRANASLQLLQEATSSASCWSDIGSKDGILLSKTTPEWKVFVAHKAVTSIETKLPTVVKRLFENDCTVSSHTFTQEVFQDVFVDAAVVANIPTDITNPIDVPTSGTSIFHPSYKRIAVKWYALAGKSKLHKPLDYQVLEFIGLVLEQGRLKCCYLFQESIADTKDFRPPVDSTHFERMQIDALIMKFERGARINGTENVLMSVALQRMPSLLDLGFKNPAQDMVLRLAKGFRDALQTVKSVTLDMNFVQTASWVPDSDRPFCSICDRPFISFFRRRHHCRVCGEVVCDQCSNILPASSAHSIPDRNNVQTVYIQADIRLCCRCLLERQGQMNQSNDSDITEEELLTWLDPTHDDEAIEDVLADRLTGGTLMSPRTTISQGRFMDQGRISEESESSRRSSRGSHGRVSGPSTPTKDQRSPVIDTPPTIGHRRAKSRELPPIDTGAASLLSTMKSRQIPSPAPEPRVRAQSWHRQSSREEVKLVRLYDSPPEDGSIPITRSQSDRGPENRPPLSIDRKYMQMPLDSPTTPPRRRISIDQRKEPSNVRVASAWIVQSPEYDAVDVAYTELVSKIRGNVHFLVVSFSESCDAQYILHRLQKLAPGVPFIGGTLGRGVCDETAWVSAKRDAIIALWGIHDPEGSYSVGSCEYREVNAKHKTFKAAQAAIGYAQAALPVAANQTPDFCIAYASPLAVDEALAGLRAAVACPVLGGCSTVSSNRDRMLQISSCSGGFRRNGGRMGGLGSHIGIAFAMCYPSVDTVVEWFSGYTPLQSVDGSYCTGMVTTADMEQQKIYAIDDRPAASMYKEWLQIASERTKTDFLTSKFPRLGYIHPFGCVTSDENGELAVQSTPVIVGMDEATGAVSTTTGIVEGTYVALMESNPDTLKEAVSQMGTRVLSSKKLQSTDIAGTLMFLSTGMQVVLGSQSMAGMVGAYKQWSGTSNLLGLTAFGEIGHLPTEAHSIPHCDSLMFSALMIGRNVWGYLLVFEQLTISFMGEKGKAKESRRSRRSRSRSRDDRHKRKKDRRSRSYERKKDRRRSRSRGRDRSRSREKSHRDRKRKKSESRSPEPRKKKEVVEKPVDVAPEPVFTTTEITVNRNETEKKKSFGGLALKDKKKSKSNKEKPESKEDLAKKAELEEKEKEKRLERLRLWREQQQQLQKQDQNQDQKQDTPVVEESNVPAAPSVKLGFLLDEDEVKQVHIWPMDEKEEKEIEEDKQKMRQETEVDPLDAFMAELNNDEQLITQQALDVPKPKVISLEELTSSNSKLDIYGSFLPPESNRPKNTNEGPVEPREETEADREAREKRELEEFMKAIKTKRETEEKIMAKGLPALLHEDDDKAPIETKKTETGRIYQGVEEDAIGEEIEDEDTRTALEILQEQQKKKDIKPVDHSSIDYLPFRKKFYIEPQDITNLTEDEVETVWNDLEIKIRGKNCPRPIQKWTQAGLSQRLLKLIARQNYVAPFAIQCQALPAIMSGRDVIGIAKTGSGKTLAFLLPMFRHILDQPPLMDGEGPIGLIMAPARELVQQIYLESKKFTKDLGLRSTAVYGGSSVSEQIANLKRGSDIVVCTPGRMIDILCMSAGKMVSLKRVTYVVLDEADRMFDMGFEPQITKIIMNIRSDRQTLLFSATFPRSVETLARKILKKPIEITVGMRSTASGDITQYAEVREEQDKFMRLLQLLGVWYEKGNVLVFVNTQQACDQIYQDLMKMGYPCLSLHGGKDQVDRDYTVDDFKRKVRTLMVATSVAGRGLDVKDLVLVINYHCPNHLEDYVHRVGRTGRAGRKGTAYTFISPQEDEFAPDLVKALENAKQDVPAELLGLAEGFKEKVRNGLARYHGSGFKGNKGFTFDESEKSEAQRAADAQRRHYEIDQGMIDATDNDNRDDDDDYTTKETPYPEELPGVPPPPSRASSGVDKARLVIERLQAIKDGTLPLSETTHFREELEINDYPQQARYKVVQKEAADIVADLTGAAVICRGTYVPPGRKPNPGERKLYLAIEGSSRHSVVQAKAELQRILDEKTLEVGLSDNKYGKWPCQFEYYLVAMNWMLIVTTINLIITGLYFYKSVVLLELTQELNTFDKLHSEYSSLAIVESIEALEDFHQEQTSASCAYQKLLRAPGKGERDIDLARTRLVHWYEKVVYFHRHGLLEDRLFTELPGSYRAKKFLKHVEPLTLVHCDHHNIADCADLFNAIRGIYNLPPRDDSIECLPDEIDTNSSTEKDEL
ncbi:DEAD/DEAH box RNA helicase [Thraustotheca clavata]|uniref:RNA helicase n=1 Tax=Thraustotheca clavata TaxID=74557 RepID=A0A1W0A5L7_9STRA|nr:DEAD/DEAH box RNA helicase [Thraustotheca clavata]